MLRLEARDHAPRALMLGAPLAAVAFTLAVSSLSAASLKVLRGLVGLGTIALIGHSMKGGAAAAVAVVMWAP